VDELHDVFISSDLHLCEGWDLEKHRYARLEVFFYDQEFSRWLERVHEEAAARGRPVLLLLNGDVFDFLGVTKVPSPEEARALGFKLTRAETRFGLASSERKSAWKMERIIAGHRPFFVALARFLARGHRLIFLRGNHDVECYWPSVQERIAVALDRIAGEEKLVPAGEFVSGRLEFRQWFYHEPGRLYVEHGNQYERSNSFPYGLCPELPGRYTVDHEVGLDYPLGSLFVRFLYNKLKTVDPYTAYYVSVDQYVRILGSQNFLDMARIWFLHLPMFLQAIKGLRLFEQSGTGDAERVHKARRARTGRLLNLEAEVESLDRLVAAPAGKTKHSFLMELLRPVIKAVLTFSGVAMLGVLAWFLLFEIIQHEQWLTGGAFGRAALLSVLAVVSFLGIFLIFSQLNRRLRATSDPAVERVAERAEQIAEILDVPVVCMGHTHSPDYRKYRGGRATYANSGTWIRMPGPWDQIKARARQFTFVRICETNVELLRWDDPNRTWEPVPLLEGYHPSALEKLLPENVPESTEGP
jgi:UDP-2,3-diacylglucosamine pyrophosphatase LpxH